MKPPPRTRNAAPLPRVTASFAKSIRWFLFVAALFRKSNWRGRVEILRLALPLLPGLIRPLLKYAAARIRLAVKLIRATYALRAIEIADEKRRLALRWKPEGRRKP